MEITFELTVGETARQAGVGEGLVREYCNEGLLQYRRMPNGWRLLPRNAPSLVRELRAARLSRRGQRRVATAPA